MWHYCVYNFSPLKRQHEATALKIEQPWCSHPRLSSSKLWPQMQPSHQSTVFNKAWPMHFRLPRFMGKPLRNFLVVFCVQIWLAWTCAKSAPIPKDRKMPPTWMTSTCHECHEIMWMILRSSHCYTWHKWNQYIFCQTWESDRGAARHFNAKSQGS